MKTKKFRIIASGASGAIVWEGNHYPQDSDFKIALEAVNSDDSLWDTSRLIVEENGKFLHDVPL